MIVKKIRGLHSLKDLTIRIKTRIDDSHAPPGNLFNLAIILNFL